MDVFPPEILSFSSLNNDAAITFINSTAVDGVLFQHSQAFDIAASADLLTVNTTPHGSERLRVFLKTTTRASTQLPPRQLARAHTQRYIFTFRLLHAHTHALTRIHTGTHTGTHALTHSHARTHARIHSLTHTLTHYNHRFHATCSFSCGHCMIVWTTVAGHQATMTKRENKTHLACTNAFYQSLRSNGKAIDKTKRTLGSLFILKKKTLSCFKP